MIDKTRIAVIDDDLSIRRSLARMLSVAGFEVVAFSSAREFLAAEHTDKISCSVSDLRMPGVDGLELQQALRARGCLIFRWYSSPGMGTCPESSAR